MTSQPGTSTEGHGQKVADHYNKLEEAGLAERTKSRIFYLRNFNNWMKSMLINEYLSRLRKEGGPDQAVAVLDLCSGKGGDLLKWKKANIKQLVCADIAETSVIQCAVRHNEMQNMNKQERHAPKLFSAEFIHADCTKDRLREKLRNQDTKFDLTSCNFSFHYSFESYEQADKMLQNACECLRPGGYFIGTTTNSNELIKRLRNSEDMSFGNEIYKVTFLTENKTDIPLFGAKYDFHLEGVVDCPEFVVHFPTMIEMAKKYDMEFVERVPFPAFFEKYINQGEGRGLIGRMQGLEPYPADEDVELMSKLESDYQTAKTKYEQILSENEQNRRPTKIGTLSQSEWEASTIYLAFAFRKKSDDATPGPSNPLVSVERRAPKRSADDSESTESPTKQARTSESTSER